MTRYITQRQWSLPLAFLLAAVLVVAGLTTLSPVAYAERSYAWPSVHGADAEDQLENRIAPPVGFERITADTGSFAHWLRGLPLKPGQPTVMLHNGRRKQRQDTHHAVINIDVGSADLQQCADACIRLYAEYLYSRGEYDAIHFNFTSGDTCKYADWRAGRQPSAIWQWAESWWPDGPDQSYAGFRKYLDLIFMYAGTASFDKECVKVTTPDSLRIGDMLLQPGFPGHVSMIVDIAHDEARGESVFLLLEGFTPAQDFVILRNAKDESLAPWHRIDCSGPIVTPDWTFWCRDFRRWRGLLPENEK